MPLRYKWINLDRKSGKNIELDSKVLIRVLNLYHIVSFLTLDKPCALSEPHLLICKMGLEIIYFIGLRELAETPMWKCFL